MKNLTLLLMLLWSITSYTQDWKAIAKDDLAKQKVTFNALEETYNTQKAALEKTSITDTVYDSLLKTTRETKKSLDALFIKRKESLAFYKIHITEEEAVKELERHFEITTYTLSGATESALPTEVYIVYGDEKVVAQKDLFKDEKTKPFFEEVFSKKSESYLGDFEFPGHRQKIGLYTIKEFDLYRKSGVRLPETNKNLYFESVKISIREGSVYDIRVLLSDADNKHKYYFVNKVPISLLRYMKKAGQSYLINKINNTNDTESTTDNQYEGYVVRLSDVLRYLNNPGDNFVPDDKDLSFPIETDKASATTKALRLYKIIEDTSLQNILELRTYTDFLGLFDDESPNGLVQIEGKADFFLAPFQVSPLLPLTFLKKTTPYVNYARIDDEIKNVNIIASDTDPTLFKIKRPLEIIEKAYLDMGIVTDIVGFSFTKEFPFSINLYIPVRYKVAAIEFEDGSDINFKTIGYGAGARIEIKRFNNFGFTNSSEWTKFNHLNRIDNLEMQDNFWIFRNESEIFYYPNKTKRQSIFLRLRSHLNITDTEDSFFQLQFGYRFALGLGKTG